MSRKYRLATALDIDDLLMECTSYAIRLANEKYQFDPPMTIYEKQHWGKMGTRADSIYPYFEDAEFYQKIHTGYDLIYKPAETKFMKLVSENGGKAYHGLKMLLYQGIIAYELWNQVSVSEEDALAVRWKLPESRWQCCFTSMHS